MLSVVVVNHRSHALADACVRSLLAGSVVPDEIIVVDNEGSHGGVSDEARANGKVRVLARPENPGYAASCNSGAALAGGDLVLFMNADVTVSRLCIERSLEAMARDHGVGVVSPRLVRSDGSLDHACHRGMPTPFASFAYKLRLHRLMPASRRLGRYTMSWLDPGTDHDIEACSGAFLLTRRSVLDATGGWDERYRFYAEDLDLCVRIRRVGWRIRYLGTVTATHLKGAFSLREVPDRLLDDDQRARRRRLRREILASHRLFFDEHLRGRSPPPTRLAIDLMFLLQMFGIEARDLSTRIQGLRRRGQDGPALD